MNHPNAGAQTSGVEIAIVGMAGRFPGANDVDAFWRNIRDGVESVTPFSDDDLRARGIPDDLLADPAYVKSGVVLEGMDRFDAGFFGYSPREAEHLDPQHRLFLETTWQALEHAGYAGVAKKAGLIGVYAGSGASLYLMRHLLPSVDWRASDIASLLGLLNGNDKDSLATRVAYKLDLRGPAVSVQTACSTSLVAVHCACRGLLNFEADLALAGGVWLNLLQEGGYRYQPGAILSPDGHCRAFDAEASGTALGSGAGVVVLKRLADALADGDTIHAVIKGSAINNDGAAKIGYTAPSVEGQAEAILAAHAMADVTADSIGYIEAHGTGTTLGDPIEIAALTDAFRASTQRLGFCAIGSVKTNVGHLDAAAGVTGLIKTVMALQHRTLPPSINFKQANPRIDFAGSPFRVNAEARPWPEGESPRRAGVSAFGMGGTNAHVIVEEAPPPSLRRSPADGEGTLIQLLRLSARSAAQCDTMVLRLADHLAAHPEQRLTDVAHTLRVGRRRFEHRAVVLARDHAEAVRVLEGREAGSFFEGQGVSTQPTVAFLFPGQGAQHVDMGRALYEGEPVFRATVDRCCDLLKAALGQDLRGVLFPGGDEDEATAAERLSQTSLTQPALFVIEYALARLWMSRGLQPDAMLGHSIGEYVAACLAGVFTLEDALEVVASRGRLLQATEPGAMLSVGLAEAELPVHLKASCDLAAVNANDLCVLAGPEDAIASAERELAGRGVAVRRLHVSHAFHSALVEPMLGEFEALLSRKALSAPRIPFVSNVTGNWISADEACSPAYWVRHARGTVRFAEGLGTLLGKPDRLLLEAGPGETLGALARRHPQAGSRAILASQCHPQRKAQNAAQVMRCMAQLWIAGIDLDAAEEPALDGARRVPLPTYPFERQSYWIPPASSTAVAAPGHAATPQDLLSRRDVDDWFHVPNWVRTPLATKDATATEPARGGVLVLGQASGLGECLCRHLREQGWPVVLVEHGAAFSRSDAHRYVVRTGEREDFQALLTQVDTDIGPLSHICHAWNLDPQGQTPPEKDVLSRGFHSLLALAQALDARGGAARDRKLTLTVVANQLEDLTGDELLCPEKATLHGPCKVIPQECAHLACRIVDVPSPSDERSLDRLVRQVAAEMVEGPTDVSAVAYRGAHRWVKHFEPVRADAAPAQVRLRDGGVYLITGGLGGVGLALARHLARGWQARLVLVGRTGLPARGQWPEPLEGDAGLAPGMVGRMRAVRELEASGAEVLVLQADVTDAAGMRDAVGAAKRRFGRLDGVVHAAGEAGGGVIAHKTPAMVAQVFAPKLAGTRALMDAVRGEPLDFVVLCSSLASLAGGLGKVDYAAANAYLDAVAAAAARESDAMVVSVNWDGWREVGMAAGMRMPEHLGIVPEQGALAFERIVNGPLRSQVAVSTIDLGARLKAEGRDILALADLAPATAAVSRRTHPRPNLPHGYVAPEGELESGLAALWSDVLGILPVGLRDPWFELGGDSLMAIQLLARVRSTFGVELHPAAFFKDPTVEALAVLVEVKLIEEIENADPVADRVSETA